MEDRRRYRRFAKVRAPMGRRVDAMWADILCAYLDAEPRSVWVLSDLLQGSNAEPLRPGSDDKRIRRVLGILPPKVSHDIACDFAAQVLAITEPHHRESWTAALEMKRRWLRGAIDDRTLRETPWGVSHSPQLLMQNAMSMSPSPSVPQAVAKYAVDLVRATIWNGRDKRVETDMLAWQRHHLKERLVRASSIP
ncbi:MAG: hypothetical protein AAGA48_22030 [Myxococcota bacterium]